MAETSVVTPTELDLPWPMPVLPPTDLPYDDGERMESPWHNGSATMLVAGYVAARGGTFDDFFAGINMFVYYSMSQIRSKDYKGPDVFFVKNVDGKRKRNYWAIWDEEGRYPDVIFELLSPSTEANDLGEKKKLYEQTFHTKEYFCVAPEVERLLGWRLENWAYTPLVPNEEGRLWSEELGLWVGPWRGVFLNQEATWLRFYHPNGDLVLLTDEVERQRAEAAEQQRDELAARMAALEAELQRLRGAA